MRKIKNKTSAFKRECAAQIKSNLKQEHWYNITGAQSVAKRVISRATSQENCILRVPLHVLGSQLEARRGMQQRKRDKVTKHSAAQRRSFFNLKQ